MKKVLVLGYGNPLRGDDGVGPAVAWALQERLLTAEAQRAQRGRREGTESGGGDAAGDGILAQLASEHSGHKSQLSNTPESINSTSPDHCSNPLCAVSASSASSAPLRFQAYSEDSFRCKALHQLTPELAADIALADLVIFIDASCDNGPGEVASRRVVPESSPSSTSFSHQLTPEVLLAFAERLYGTCPEAVLLSVGAASFEYGEGLSAEVQAAVPVLLDRVQAACAALHS